GEGAAVEENLAPRSFLQQEAGGFEHHFHHEVVLRNGVFDIFRREQGSADFVFAKERALRTVSQFASQRGFTGTGETGHQNDHAVEIVAEAEFGNTLCSRLNWRPSLPLQWRWPEP